MPGRRMITMLSIVLLAVLMLASYKAFWVYQQLQLLHAPKPPVSVAVANAVEKTWQRQLPAAAVVKPVDKTLAQALALLHRHTHLLLPSSKYQVTSAGETSGVLWG